MKVGDLEMDEKLYNRLLLNLVVSIHAEMTVQREFIMMSITQNHTQSLDEIQAAYFARYKSNWDDLTSLLYAKFGKLDFEDLFSKEF